MAAEITIVTQKDLENYVEGLLSPSEARCIETAMLDDERILRSVRTLRRGAVSPSRDEQASA